MARGGPRSVVLGVDSLDLALLRRWSAQGLLPFFASMLSDGSLVSLSTVSRVLQGAVWPSLLSGRSPGHHGSYFLTQLTNGTYDFDGVEADHAEPDPYYGVLDSNGVRCAIVDIPNDLPAKGFTGLQVVDWLTEFQYWRFSAAPAGTRSDIRRKLGTLNPRGGYGPTIDSLAGHRQLRERLERSIGMKSALAAELLGRADFDHLFLVFAEAHKAGHFLWKYMDATHPDHVPAEEYLRDALLGIYQRLDTEVGRLAELARQDNLLIFSDHGMQANYRGDQFIAPILRHLGLSAPTQPAQSPGSALGSEPATAVAAGSGGKLRAALRSAVMSWAPESVLRPLRRHFGAAARVDWKQTRVFQLPTDRNSYLRINLRGREPDGTVAPGAAYNELLDLLESEFKALRNAQTGRPAVEAVFRVHEMYPGPRRDDLPDLAILWSSEAPIHAIESSRFGRLEHRVREDRSGNHRPEGFILARGPAIRSGVRAHGDVMQVAGTLLALHGIPVPSHYEQPPLRELLRSPPDSTGDA